MIHMRPVVTACLIGLLFCFISGPNCFAVPRETPTEAILSNGMKVLFLENHKAPIVSFQVWYRAGSRNENWGKTGLAHLMEHLMFKGTEKVSGADFTQTIEKNGGEFNAFTSSDYAAYFETLSSDRIQVALDLESDRMKNLVLSEQDFETERKVVMEERRMRTDDNPQAYLLEQLNAAAYQTQPYHWPPVGWSEDIARITLGDVRNFYRKYYDPANAFIVVVGDFKKDDLLPRLEKTFGVIPKGPPPESTHYEDPPQTGGRTILVERPSQLASIIVGYHVPTVRSPDGCVLDVISSILSEAKSSRLYEHLVTDRALVLEADSDYSLLSFDPGLFYVSATLMPGKKTDEVEEAITLELEGLKNVPVGDVELEKAKNQLEASFVFMQDSLFNQGMLLAEYEIAVGWRAFDEYIPSIRKVTPEDIQRVARLYFVSRNRTSGAILPVAAEGGTPPPVGSAVRDKTLQFRQPVFSDGNPLSKDSPSTPSRRAAGVLQ